MSRCERPSGPCPWPRCACSTPCPTCSTPWVSLDELDRDDDQAALEREGELDRDDPFDWPDVDGDEERSCGFPHCDCSTPCKLWDGVWADPEIDELVADGPPAWLEEAVAIAVSRDVAVLLTDEGEIVFVPVAGSATPSGEASLPRDPASSGDVGSAARESE